VGKPKPNSLEARKRRAPGKAGPIWGKKQKKKTLEVPVAKRLGEERSIQSQVRRGLSRVRQAHKRSILGRGGRLGLVGEKETGFKIGIRRGERKGANRGSKSQGASMGGNGE